MSGRCPARLWPARGGGANWRTWRSGRAGEARGQICQAPPCTRPERHDRHHDVVLVDDHELVRHGVAELLDADPHIRVVVGAGAADQGRSGGRRPRQSSACRVAPGRPFCVSGRGPDRASAAAAARLIRPRTGPRTLSVRIAPDEGGRDRAGTDVRMRGSRWRNRDDRVPVVRVERRRADRWEPRGNGPVGRPL
jgi:hypothetical protein